MLDSDVWLCTCARRSRHHLVDCGSRLKRARKPDQWFELPARSMTRSATAYWQANYSQAKADNAAIQSDAVQLNSPTVSGVSASDAASVPVATLGKDVSGKLWLLATADGDVNHQMSNTSPMTVTITVPSAIPAGTVLTVVDENRTVTVDSNHQFTDTLGTASVNSGTASTCGLHSKHSLPAPHLRTSAGQSLERRR